MATTGTDSKQKGAAVEGGEDHISALPNAILEQVLSILPTHEAVRSCVLSRRWRVLWKSLSDLRITDADSWSSVAKFNTFVNHLVLLRLAWSLDSKEFFFENHSKESVQYVEEWIGHAVVCDVQVLRVLVSPATKPLLLVYVPLISRSLRILQLQCVELDDNALDFSSCPVLGDLKMSLCRISAHKMSSQSLKHLCVTECNITQNFHTRICTPGLVSLRLSAKCCRAPLLESMPLLVTASVRLSSIPLDHRRFGYHGGSGSDKSDGSGKCVLLGGLTNATYLELEAADGVHIFKLDLACCPIFNKLKTLLLNEWVVGRDFCALLWFLQHTPVLEKLIILLHEDQKHLMNMEESHSLVEQFLQSRNLKIVEVRCTKIDERIHIFSKMLSTYGITPDKFSIQKRGLIVHSMVQF